MSSLRSIRRNLAFGAALLAFPIPAFGQSEGRAAQASSTDDRGGLQEIVVTAQKRSESIQDVPLSVTALSGEKLAEAQITDTTSLGQIAPSLTYTSGFGIIANSFNIRGVGSYVSELGVQPAVSVVVDGIPLARNAEFIGQLGEIERLEVLNGPQGTLFGRNSTGGVINVVRAGPTSDLTISADARLQIGKVGGTEILTNFAISGPITPGIRARVSGYVLDRSGYVKNIALNGKNSGSEKSWALVGKLALDLGDKAELLLTGEGRRYRAGLGANIILKPIAQVQQPLIPNVTAKQQALLGAAIGDPFKINQDDEVESALDSWGVTADLKWEISEGLSLKSVTGYRDVEVGTQPDVDSSPASPNNTFGWDIISIPVNNLTERAPRRKVFWKYLTHESRLEYRDESISLIAGGYFQAFKEKLYNAVPLLLSAQNLGRLAQVGTPTGPAADYPYYFSDAIIVPTNKTKTIAAFVDATWTVTPGLKIFAGARISSEKITFDYDQTSYFIPVQKGINYDAATFTPLVPGTRIQFGASSRDTEWSGRAGLRYEIAPNVSIYGTASRGYIGAGVDLSRATGGTPANPSGAFLRPSMARNFELGLKSEFFDRRVRLNLAVYDMLVKDLQAQALIPGTVLNRVQNAGDLKSRGVELSVDTALAEQFSLGGSLAYTDTKFRDLRTSCYPGQTAVEGCVGGAQVIDGKSGLNTPKLKFNVDAEYRIPVSENGAELFVRGRYSWQSKVYYTLDHDPEAVQKSYGLLDASIGFKAADGQFEISVFAKNLLNQRFCQAKSAASIIARSFCWNAAYDAQRLLGAAIRVKM